MSTTLQQAGSIARQPDRPVATGDLLQALLAMLVFDLVLSLGGFKRLYRVVERWAVKPRPTDPAAIRRVCDAVDRACTIYPKHALCLLRSAVTSCLLRRHGVAARMVIGCRKLPFMGHAWVEVDGCVVNDGPAVQQLYAVLDRL
jgi:hypothetical protein